MRPAIFLDRDGVLNRAVVRNRRPYPPASPRDLVIYPEAPAVLADLKAAGFWLVVVTNQPDVARGTTPLATVQAIHARLRALLPVDDILACFHDDGDGCSCRKPLPGLLFEAASRYRLDLAASVMIGDRWRDIDAGAAAGCTTILIDHGYDEELRTRPDFVTTSLAEVPALLRQRSLAVALR